MAKQILIDYDEYLELEKCKEFYDEFKDALENGEIETREDPMSFTKRVNINLHSTTIINKSIEINPYNEIDSIKIYKNKEEHK